jgi:hypothetical protein
VSFHLRYDLAVKRLVPATVAVLVTLLLSPVLRAQIRGLPPTASSVAPGTLNFGLPPTAPGIGTPGLPPTATSVGPNGLSTNFAFVAPGFAQPDFGIHRHHRRRFSQFGNFVAVPVPVLVAPYAPLAYAPEAADDEAADESGSAGPTVFEHDGPRAYTRNHYPQPQEDEFEDGYPPRPVDTRPQGTSDRRAATSPDEKPEIAQPASLLVFKDGHKLEVQNYAIVGDTLYDFTPGRARKIALADLDMKATSEANDDRGVDFRIPLKGD